MPKHLLYEDQDMLLEEEFVEGVVFIHLSVHNFNKTSLKRMRTLMKTLKLSYAMDGFREIFALTPDTKFCKLVDHTFKVIDSYVIEGKNMEVIVWEIQ